MSKGGDGVGLPRIAVVTIGQAPRADITPEFRGALGGSADLVEAGALDHLSESEIAGMAPKKGEELLVSRLRDGTEVHLAERHVLDLVQRRIAELFEPGGGQSQPPDLVVLLCTGSFPNLRGPVPIVFPDRLLCHVANAVAPNGRIACVAPSAEQRDLTERKWANVAGELIFAAVSPYTSSRDECVSVAHEVAAADPDLIVLDCLGFGMATKELMRSVSRAPVLLPRTLAARIAAELVEGGSPARQR